MTIYEKIIQLFENMTTEEEFDALNVNKKWQKVKHTWTEAENHLSDINTSTQDRIVSCYGDSANKPCPAKSYQDGKSYCNACGCHEKELANINVIDGKSKLNYEGLCCPLRKKGFKNSV